MRLVGFAVLLFIPLLALAQVVAPAPDDLGAMLGGLLQAVQGRNWVIAVGAGLSLTVFALRRFGGTIVPWFRTDRGGAVLTLLIGVLGALALTFYGGKVSALTIFDGLALGFTMAGGYVTVKKIGWPSDAKAASSTPSSPPATPPAPSAPGTAAVVLLVGLGLAGPSLARAEGMDELAAASAEETSAALTAEEQVFLEGARAETLVLQELTRKGILLAHSDYSDLSPELQKAMASGDLEAVQRELLAQADAAPATSSTEQSSPPAKTGVLSLDLGAWSAHANVAVGAVGYSFTREAWLASVPITGLYALCYRPWGEACVAAGGSFSVGDDAKPRGSLDAALLSPAVANPFQPAGSGGFRIGLDTRFTFGPAHEVALLAILPFQF